MESQILQRHIHSLRTTCKSYYVYVNYIQEATGSLIRPAWYLLLLIPNTIDIFWKGKGLTGGLLASTSLG